MTSSRCLLGLRVETTPATAGIDLLVGVVERLAPIGEPLCLHTAEDRLEFRLANMEGVVMTLRFRLVGEIKVRLSLI